MIWDTFFKKIKTEIPEEAKVLKSKDNFCNMLSDVNIMRKLMEGNGRIIKCVHKTYRGGNSLFYFLQQKKRGVLLINYATYVANLDNYCYQCAYYIGDLPHWDEVKGKLK